MAASAPAPSPSRSAAGLIVVLLLALATAATLLRDAIDQRRAAEVPARAALDSLRDAAAVNLEGFLRARRAAGNVREAEARFLSPLTAAVRVARTARPERAEPHYLLGRMYRAILAPDHARTQQDAALAKEPAYGPALYERIVLLAEEIARARADQVAESGLLPADAPLPFGVRSSDLCGAPLPGCSPEIAAALPADPKLDKARALLRELLPRLEAAATAGAEGAVVALACVECARGLAELFAPVADPAGAPARAAAALTRALALDPKLEEAHEALAAIAWGAGDLAAAEAAYTQGLDVDAGYIPFLLGRGFARLALTAARARVGGHSGADLEPFLAGAEQDFAAAAEVNPRLGGAWLGRALAQAARAESPSASAYSTAPMFTTAAEYFGKALELEPGSFTIFVQYSGCLARWGEECRARRGTQEEPYWRLCELIRRVLLQTAWPTALVDRARRVVRCARAIAAPDGKIQYFLYSRERNLRGLAIVPADASAWRALEEPFARWQRYLAVATTDLDRVIGPDPGTVPIFFMVRAPLGDAEVVLRAVLGLPIAEASARREGFPPYWTRNSFLGVEEDTDVLRWTVEGFAARERGEDPGPCWSRALAAHERAASGVSCTFRKPLGPPVGAPPVDPDARARLPLALAVLTGAARRDLAPGLAAYWSVPGPGPGMPPAQAAAEPPPETLVNLGLGRLVSAGRFALGNDSPARPRDAAERALESMALLTALWGGAGPVDARLEIGAYRNGCGDFAGADAAFADAFALLEAALATLTPAERAAVREERFLRSRLAHAHQQRARALGQLSAARSAPSPAPSAAPSATASTAPAAVYPDDVRTPDELRAEAFGELRRALELGLGLDLITRRAATAEFGSLVTDPRWAALVAEAEAARAR
ncbi:MAG: hypothetical protein HZA54_05050 [Planctomycetes bacterium]|nr:hypothetical protein [Planctomycetota bacterium]